MFRQSLFRTAAMSLVFGASALALSSAATSAHAGDDGYGWDQLEALVDQKIYSAMQQNKIPGMTVAVSKNGKLILWKGYGYSYADHRGATTDFAQMKYNMRSRIGSVSKAVVTGPAGYKLLKEKNIPLTTKVYGPNGVFKNKFYAEIGTGAKRFYPIVAMAINNKDWVYTWYANGTVSVGSSDDLDKYQAPKPFTLPPGKTVADIHEIAITANSRAYVWYKDGSRSIGSSTKLDNYQGILKNSEGDAITPKFPAGKRIANVVGIGIAKSNDHVYVWYDDGTMSSGTSTDFTKYIPSKPYSLANGMSRYGIRAMGVAANDRVYTWHTNGKAQSGMSTDLDKYRTPYAYAVPNTPPLGGPQDPRKWYYNITLRDLFRHTTGFRSSSEMSGIAAMFNVDEDDVNYTQIHQYVLRTKQLRWAPGAQYAYDNQHFGLWTILTPQIAGKSYRSYAINNYLKPMGAYGPVRPLTTQADARDSHAHYTVDINGTTKYRAYPFSNVTQGHTDRGLAAGGWTASAGDLLYITNKLDDQYSVQELLDMGWRPGGRNKLEHNGSRGDGAAYVAMFPVGFKSNDGLDLSDIHVALAANISTSTSELEKLSNEIVRAVPEANVSSGYDIWQTVNASN